MANTAGWQAEWSGSKEISEAGVSSYDIMSLYIGRRRVVVSESTGSSDCSFAESESMKQIDAG
jgi:hypothetical protein